MEIKQAVDVLRKYQKWRMGGKGKMPEPKLISAAIVVCIRFITMLTNDVDFTEKKPLNKAKKNEIKKR